MNFSLPTDWVFVLGSIAILSFSLAAIAISYVFLLIKLARSEKDKVFLQSKIRDHAGEILQQSHEKGLQIIQEATKKAQVILEDVEIFSDEAKAQFTASIQATNKKQEELLDKRSEEVLKLYEKFVADLRNSGEGQFKIISKDIENHSLTLVGEFREALESERILMHKQLESKVEEEYKKVQKQIEDYKVDQMKKVDKQIFDILHALTRNVLGRSLSLRDHEDLVQRALTQMKLEMDSEI